MPRKKIFIGVAVGFVGLIGFLIWLIIYGLGKYDRELQHEIVLAKEEGVWIYSPDDFLPKIKGVNGAAEYMQIEKLLKKVKSLNKAPDLSNPAELAKTKAYLHEIAPALKLAEHACLAPYVLFDDDYYHPMEVSFETLHSLRRVSDGFRFRSYYEGTERAWEDINRCILVRLQASYSPGLIGSYTKVSARSILFLEAERLLSADPHFTNEAETLLHEVNEPLNINLALRVEMYGAFQYLHDPAELNRHFDARGAHILARGAINWITTAWEVDIVRAYRKLLHSLASPHRPSELIGIGEAFDNEVRAGGSFGNPFMGDGGISVEQLMRSGASVEARHRILAQVIAILKAPQIPDRLPLGGDLAIDPTTDKPLHYMHTKSSFRIYAVGMSGKDLGGVHYRYGLKPEEYDIVFEYPYHPQSKAK